jgi:hypothetical protein
VQHGARARQGLISGDQGRCLTESVRPYQKGLEQAPRTSQPRKEGLGRYGVSAGATLLLGRGQRAKDPQRQGNY